MGQTNMRSIAHNAKRIVSLLVFSLESISHFTLHCTSSARVYQIILLTRQFVHCHL
jgi:hypothetical protein